MPLTLKLDEEVEGKRGNDQGDQQSIDERCVYIHSTSLLTFALTTFINECHAIYLSGGDTVMLFSKPRT